MNDGGYAVTDKITLTCNQPERCNWIPIHEDEPTEQTSEVIAMFDTYTDCDIIETSLREGAKLIEATRRRGVSGMACTKCGLIRKA
jgi:hypothetical protein